MFKKARRIGKEWAVKAYDACFNPTYGKVLMLHRIGPPEPDRLPCVAELSVTVERLQRYVDEHRAKYDFVSLDEVNARMLDRSLRKRPFLCFTLDDGYRDNLTYGLPFFERNNIPFAVFLTVDFIDRHPAFNYPFILERVVANQEDFTQWKERILQWDYDGFEQKFKETFGTDLTEACYEDLTMRWEEVRQLAQSPLCTIGSHSMTHFRLSNLTKEELAYELGESKQRIEAQIAQPVKYVSYPFGWTTDVNEMVFEVAKEVGYEMGFVSHGGGVRKNDQDVFRVKREMLVLNE